MDESMERVLMTIEAKYESDQRDIVSWRFRQLIHAGADNHTAQIIAERLDVSLHQAVEMLENNCKPNLMVAILL